MPAHIPDSNFLVPPPGGAGDVVGPASSTDHAIARYDGDTGVLLQDSGIIIDDSDNLTVGAVAVKEDGGAVTLVDMSVTADPAAGTQESYSFAVDGTPIAKIYAEADSSGDIQNPSFQVLKFLNFQEGSELTIAAGVITATTSFHTVDTASDDASDDLDTINGGKAGNILTIKANHTDRTVVVKHGTGNIQCNHASDFSLDNVNDTWMGLYDGNNWLELFRSSNG